MRWTFFRSGFYLRCSQSSPLILYLQAHRAATFWAAMKTIIVADALMGLDNVLAVAGAAQGSFVLVIVGLLASIPIVIWGSQLILKFVERYPVIIYIGAG